MILPSWASDMNGTIEVDPDVVYPLFLNAVGYTDVTQEALETCRMVFTRYIHELNHLQNLHLVIKYSPKWALRNYPSGISLDHMSVLHGLRVEGKLPG